MSYLERLKEITEKYQDDAETLHIEMDRLLCEIIEDNIPNGNKIVKLFNSQDIWYA